MYQLDRLGWQEALWKCTHFVNGNVTYKPEALVMGKQKGQ